jgi:hypothetical protein
MFVEPFFIFALAIKSIKINNWKGGVMCSTTRLPECKDCDHTECPGKRGVLNGQSERTPFVCPRQQKQYHTVLATVAIVRKNNSG